MNQGVIVALAKLARISLTEAELERFTAELPAILDYVGAVQAMTDEAPAEPEYGPRYNVFRADEVTNRADEYTEDILSEMPETDGRYLKVQKILKQTK